MQQSRGGSRFCLKHQGSTSCLAGSTFPSPPTALSLEARLAAEHFRNKGRGGGAPCLAQDDSPFIDRDTPKLTGRSQGAGQSEEC